SFEPRCIPLTPTRPTPACTRSAGWARSTKWSRRSSTSNRPGSSPERSCTSTAAKAPATNHLPKRPSMASTTDNETILRSVLDDWKAAFDAHNPRQAAAIFTDDAIFQGLHPYTVGLQGIAEYYASLPLGMTALYRILETRRPADNLILGYLSVDFTF